ncbi:MAG: type IV secretory system conjugative DNA transfer family protein [Alphaproteobacteria bacterium]|nr:type IV secretory system conjugative DNA transfer family protein [Alphaproteobacteria bacterium]MBU2379531.1 type IV secretory system conjugative DNA transfer family protein [Alphaproteobacteria bacterium]
MASTTGFILGREPDGQTHRKVGFATVLRAPPGASGLVSDASDTPAAVFAPTGAGKKRNILLPTLLSADNPAIVLDVKGELARESADFRRSIGHEVHVLDAWNQVVENTDSFNPLDTLDGQSPSLADDAYALARLLVDLAPIKEAYWDESAQSVVAGLIAHVVSCEKESDPSLRRVWQLLTCDDVIYGLAVLLDTLPVAPFARAQIASLLALSADNTRSCIVSVIHQHLRLFGSECVQKAIATTTFDLDAVRDGRPVTIYIVVPPSKLKSHAALLRLWLAAFMNLMLERRRAPERPTLLLLDEIAQLGRMDQIPQAITLARGYGMRCMLVLQSYGQLRHTYPGEHDVLIENCGSIVTFGHASFSMSQQMAAVLGDVSAERLFGMTADELAIRKPGESTRIIRRVDFLTDPEFRGLAGPNPMFGTRSPPGR